MHFHHITSVVFAAVVLAVGVSADALATETETIRFNLRQDPNDPSSAIIRTIDLDLESQEVDGNDVGWAVVSLKVSELDANGQATQVWIDAAPFVDSTDGLWWIEHADPLDPHRSEFVMPPLLEGVAAAEDPADPDLDYSIEGVTYNAPPEPPFEVTAALDYTFTPTDTGVPVSTVLAAATEIHPDDEPPIG